MPSDDYLAKSPDASRIGKAVEHLVAATCILASGAQLNVSTSLVDDEGVDLVFHRRGGSATLAAQVKSRRTTTAVLGRGRFSAQVRHQTFRPRTGLYLLFVVANAEDATFGPVWLVPSVDFAANAKEAGRRRHLRFNASLGPNARDKWRPYRCERAELPGKILSILADAEGI